MADISFLKMNDNSSEIETMSRLATNILREYYDPLIGVSQNDYMLSIFQTPTAIKEQYERGYQYYFICLNNENIGFLAFYLRKDHLYLSKIYLKKEYRNKGYGRIILSFLKEETLKLGVYKIELNVNKYNPTRFVYEALGFKKVRDECNDIGNGYFMDDYVYALEIN